MMHTYPAEWSRLKPILCHDWLTGMRGGERVLEILCQGFPAAPVFTLFHDPDHISDRINSHPITPSWLQRVPGITRRYRNLLPLFPLAIESLRTPEADILISTSHCVAKGLKVGGKTRHLCYCFTPMRYAWTFYAEYFGGSRLRAAGAKILLPMLRSWDRRSSKRVHRFVAISRHVQRRILDFYGRESDVVYPPVDMERWTPGENPGEKRSFDLIVSALVPYKRVDLAVQAYTKLGYPLKIVGIGSELWKLRSKAGSNIDFLGWRPDYDILQLYRSCRMLVFPGEEDFGIVPVEAQACGRPVVAFGKGGTLETVREGVSGVFFREQTDKALIEAVRHCASIRWESGAIRANAERFGIQNFIDGLTESIRMCASSADGTESSGSRTRREP